MAFPDHSNHLVYSNFRFVFDLVRETEVGWSAKSEDSLRI